MPIERHTHRKTGPEGEMDTYRGLRIEHTNQDDVHRMLIGSEGKHKVHKTSNNASHHKIIGKQIFNVSETSLAFVIFIAVHDYIDETGKL